MGIIDSNREPKNVAFMFDKSIKLLVCGFRFNISLTVAVLITENGEV